MKAKTERVETRPLGEAGRALRVLNFAGGTFDTVMQLGVAHALLVIQGRAPDAIVGVSAGAIQAAAVAEILQAGENVAPDAKTLDKEQFGRRFRQRQEARVKALHGFIDAAQRAPEELLDASLPDTYQIDSFDPLQPLRTSRFLRAERDERERMLSVRSGVIRLYNDFLGVALPIGAITRFVRRWLGFQAAAEEPGRWKRALIRTLEIFRIWLLAGAQLHRLATAAPLLVRPLFFRRSRARVATAGSLIFRFRAVRLLVVILRFAVSLFVLATTWVTISALPVVVAWVLPAETPWYVVVMVVSPYLLPIGLGLVQVATKHDSATRLGAFRDGIKGIVQFVISLLVWGGFAFLIIGSIEGYESLLQAPLRSAAVLPFLIGTGTSLLIALWAVGSFWHERAQLALNGQPKLGFMRWYGKRFLDSYNLSRSLFHHHGLEKFLSDLFDRDYYGRQSIEKALEAALRSPPIQTAGRAEPATCFEGKKKIGDYYAPNRQPAIALGLGVADIGSGEVRVMSERASIVCGLRAATALVPLFPAVRFEGRLYTDSTNVTPVPMPALLDLLRRHGVNSHATMIHAYRVAPVPFSRPRLPQENPERPLLNLIDIAFRAGRLREYRDADLERRLTDRYTEVIPEEAPEGEDRCWIRVQRDAQNGERSYFRIRVAPVELEMPVGLNGRIVFADREQRRTEILRTIAKGCRASLQVMIADAISSVAEDIKGEKEQKTEGLNRPGKQGNQQPALARKAVPCHDAVCAHLKGERKGLDPAVAEIVKLPLPGSRGAAAGDKACKSNEPPGLWEICRHCELGAEGRMLKTQNTKQQLLWQGWANTAPSWPHEYRRIGGEGADRYFELAPARKPDPKVVKSLGRYWPRVSTDRQPAKSVKAGSHPVERPTVSLLFSGGVFRGVFQIGVINALNELDVTPDVVAGASVGSITGAIAAHLLAVTDDRRERAMQLARLAGAFLAVDRIILTDRFADFVREFTIRAAGTQFSLRQADRLFRQYDRPLSRSFDHGARQVVAGIERLLYINFYQLNELVKMLRFGHGREAGQYGRELIQQWLNRMNVGEEVLGAEALEALVHHFILRESRLDFLERDWEDPELLVTTFQRYVAKGVVMLATATDLTDGRLITLGDPFCIQDDPGPVDLREALLASSAFPGVFRPRWSPQLFPNSPRSHQFIDGGVMDNLPIDAVVQLLTDVSQEDLKAPLVTRRPEGGVPHLAFAASLEPKVGPISSAGELSALESYWPALRRRVKQLGFNGKLDNYHQAAREISGLYKYFAGDKAERGAPAPLDLEIAALKPNWLCGTFAFHPMLGYERARQAQSIAHGCKLTLQKFKNDYEEKWLQAWGMRTEGLLGEAEASESQAQGRELRRKLQDGVCWWREGRKCPFSQAALKNLNRESETCSDKLDDVTIDEISRIHVCCRQRETHIAH